MSDTSIVLAVHGESQVESAVSTIANSLDGHVRTVSLAGGRGAHPVVQQRLGCMVLQASTLSWSGADVPASRVPILLLLDTRWEETSFELPFDAPLDVLSSPWTSEELRAAVVRNVDHSRARRAEVEELARLRERLSHFTDEECRALGVLLSGGNRRRLAARFGVSLQEADAMRRRLTAKLGVRSLAEFVRFALADRPPAPERETTDG